MLAAFLLLIILPLVSSLGKQCGPGQLFTECGIACPLTCADVIEGTKAKGCIQSCQMGCVCKPGFALHGTQCIPEEQCKIGSVDWNPKTNRTEIPTCPTNMEYVQCSSVCEDNNCWNVKTYRCFFVRCGTPSCRCKVNHVRKTSNFGDGCIHVSQCPKNPIEEILKQWEQDQA